MIKQLKGKDLPALREKWWKEQDKICPILNHKIPLSDCTLDHLHKLKSERACEKTGKGFCRGVLSRCGNSWEGKISNSFKRLGLNKYIDIVSALRNLADYLEHNHFHDDDVKYIHPNEAPQKLKITKRSYNNLKRIMKKAETKKKIPKYTGNPTKPLVALFEKHNVKIEYYERSDAITDN